MSWLTFISVGELKYRIFLLRVFKIKNTPATEKNKSTPKREALFLLFLEALNALD